MPHHIRLIAWNIRVGGGRCIELITDQLLGEPASPRNSLLVASRWPVRIHPTGAVPTEPNCWILANIQTPIPFALGAMHVPNRITAPMPYFMLLAGFVEEVLGVSKSQLGSLISIQNVGSLGGSLFIASMPARDRGKMMLYSSLLLGVALIFFAASTNYWLTAGILIVVGLGQSGRMSLGNVLVQSYSEDSYRGRVMSIYMMEFGVTMIGTFFIGMLAAWIGVQWAIGGTAVWLVLMLVYLMTRTELVRVD